MQEEIHWKAHEHPGKRSCSDYDIGREQLQTELNEKLIICLDCVAKHNLRQPRYRNNVKKRRANSNTQQRVAAENRAANKEANRNVLRPETLSGILDAMDEQDRNSV